MSNPKAPYYKEANRIKQRVRKGKQTKEENEWLNRYKRGDLDGLPLKCDAVQSTQKPASDVTGESATNAGDAQKDPLTQGANASEQPPLPPPIDLPPIDVDGTSPAPTEESGTSIPSSTGQETSSEQTSKNEAPHPFASGEIQIGSAAYREFMNAGNLILKDMEAPILVPDWLIEIGCKGVDYLVADSLLKVDPKKAAIASALAPPALGLGSGLWALYQKRKKARPAPPLRVVESPPVQVAPPPAPKPEPPKVPASVIADVFGQGQGKQDMGYGNPLEGLWSQAA